MAADIKRNGDSFTVTEDGYSFKLDYTGSKGIFGYLAKDYGFGVMKEGAPGLNARTIEGSDEARKVREILQKNENAISQALKDFYAERIQSVNGNPNDPVTRSDLERIRQPILEGLQGGERMGNLIDAMAAKAFYQAVKETGHAPVTGKNLAEGGNLRFPPETSKFLEKYEASDLKMAEARLKRNGLTGETETPAAPAPAPAAPPAPAPVAEAPQPAAPAPTTSSLDRLVWDKEGTKNQLPAYDGYAKAQQIILLAKTGGYGKFADMTISAVDGQRGNITRDSLSVLRLDNNKGPADTLASVERLLKKDPEFRQAYIDGLKAYAGSTGRPEEAKQYLTENGIKMEGDKTVAQAIEERIAALTPAASTAAAAPAPLMKPSA